MHASPIDRVLADQQDREQETLQAADANLPIGETVGIRCMGHGRRRVDGHRLEYGLDMQTCSCYATKGKEAASPIAIRMTFKDSMSVDSTSTFRSTFDQFEDKT